MNQSATLKDLLCEQWCAEAHVVEDAVGLRLSLPLVESDGDAVTVWLSPRPGGWQIRDCGTTFMRLSYDMDVDLLADGQRSRTLERILKEHQITSTEGELSTSVEERDLGSGLLRFGQGLLRVNDIKMWTRARVTSTFYDDLRSSLLDIVGADRLAIEYHVPNVPDAGNYPVDYAVTGGARPLYIFGVPNSDKAKLATIVLLHLQQANQNFDSLIIPSDIEAIGKPDLRRLLNAANDFVDSSSSIDAISRKIQRHLV